MSPMCGETTMRRPQASATVSLRWPPTASTGSGSSTGRSSSSGAMPRPRRIGRGPARRDAHHRVVGRPHDRPVVVQERVGDRARAASPPRPDRSAPARRSRCPRWRPPARRRRRAAGGAAGCRAGTRRPRAGPAPRRLRAGRRPGAAPARWRAPDRSSAACSSGPISSSSRAASSPSAPRCGNITASGLSGRRLRSRRRCTAASLRASHSR